MKVLGIIQARTGSTRLHEKAVKKLCSKELILHVVDRVKESVLKDNFIVAVPDDEKETFINLLKKNRIKYFKGSPENVLKRFYDCVKDEKVDAVIRITGDNPFIESSFIDKAVELYKKKKYLDYIYIKDCPIGTGIELISKKALRISYNRATTDSEKEHVTIYIKNNIKRFKTNYIIPKISNKLKKLSVTVDTYEDLKFARKLMKYIKKNKLPVNLESIEKALERKKEIQNINKEVKHQVSVKTKKDIDIICDAEGKKEIQNIKKRVKHQGSVKTKKDIDIICAAGRDWGTGHLIRSITVAQLLKSKGYRVELILENYMDKRILTKILKKFEAGKIKTYSEIEQLRSICKEKKDILILDIKERASMIAYNLKDNYKKVIAIETQRVSDNINVLIDSNTEKINKAWPKIKTYLGFEYSIINPEFIKNRENFRVNKQVKAILLNLGGITDTGKYNLFIKKLQNYCRLKKIKIDILNFNKSRIKKLSEIIYKYDLAIVSAGVLLKECIAGSIPFLALAVNAGQRMNLKYLKKKIKINDIFIEENLSNKTQIKSNLEYILNYNNRKKMINILKKMKFKGNEALLKEIENL